MTQQLHEVYLALGSNVGKRHTNLRAAVERLAAHVAIERVSSLYETAPAYVLDQPQFLNAVLRGRTGLDPQSLLRFVKDIERDLGRTTGVRFGPRVIDIDIVLYGNHTVASDELTIPHPRMIERPFVLVPLAEIAPFLLPPGWLQTVGEAAATVRGNGDILVRKGALNDAEIEDLAS